MLRNLDFVFGDLRFRVYPVYPPPNMKSRRVFVRSFCIALLEVPCEFGGLSSGFSGIGVSALGFSDFFQVFGRARAYTLLAINVAPSFVWAFDLMSSSQACAKNCSCFWRIRFNFKVLGTNFEF